MPTVKPEALRDAAKKLTAEDGPIAYLRNVQRRLAGVDLSTFALTPIGIGARNAHNAAATTHHDNVKTGVDHLDRAAEALEKAAQNWEKSDQPWVVR